MRSLIIKIARQDPTFRKQLIRKVAMEFATQEALDAYLKSHPKANPKNHSVSKSKETSKGSDKERAKNITRRGRKKKTQDIIPEAVSFLEDIISTKDINKIFDQNRSLSEFIDEGGVKPIDIKKSLEDDSLGLFESYLDEALNGVKQLEQAVKKNLPKNPTPREKKKIDKLLQGLADAIKDLT